jgi:hypothetical protein
MHERTAAAPGGCSGGNIFLVPTRQEQSPHRETAADPTKDYLLTANAEFSNRHIWLFVEGDFLLPLWLIIGHES